MDTDLTTMDREQLAIELQRLRDGVRTHRDARGHDRCWLDDLQLYRMLPETPQVPFTLPPREEFLAGCARFWELRAEPEHRVHDLLCPAIFRTGDVALSTCTCGASTRTP